MPRVRDPRALVGYETSDDASVFRLGAADDPEAEALLATVDFFTPVVESPFDFGRIAAANALSDIYAMGGEPLFALNVVGFPVKSLPLEVLSEILKGGSAVAAEAGIAILGGHSADFDVPIYGLSVTGRVKASGIRRNSGAKDGDALVLTKPIGTGILTSALRAHVIAAGSRLAFLAKAPQVSPEEEAALVASMARLNRSAARAADPYPVSASTDVTGYGLLGHLREMTAGSGLAAEISLAAVPLLAGARRLADAGVAPEGTRKNLEAIRPVLDGAEALGEADLLLLADAQTSGGLLVALPEEAAEAYVAAARAAGDGAAVRIGRFSAGEAGRIRVIP